MTADTGGLRQRFESVVAEADERSGPIGDALMSVAALLSSRPSLRRAVTDTGRAAEDRADLVHRLLDNRVDAQAVELVAAATGERWATPRELVRALEELGVLAHLAAAEHAGRLERVEDELFRFGQVVQEQPRLRAALVDRSAPDGAQAELVRRLLADDAAAETVRLVEHVVSVGTGRIEDELHRLVELAAGRRERRVAVVRVAKPLRAEHRDRLERALSAQVGRPVQVNLVVEPELVGGIRVEIGDEVVDGSVRARLADVRRRLAAA